MKRVEFRLSMPNRGSWNGQWSGAERNYSIVRTLTDKKIAALLGTKARDSWGYNFGDGWFASVEVRIVPTGERLRKSDGFAGYDWMVQSILADGEIYGPTNPRPVAGEIADGSADAPEAQPANLLKSTVGEAVAARAEGQP